MISYELVKELKDAGFPQGDELFCRCAFLTPEEKEADGVEEIYDCKTERVYRPTLEELIEAFGDKTIVLHKYSSTSGNRSVATSQGRMAEGTIPEEAVARLWLALNKK